MAMRTSKLTAAERAARLTVDDVLEAARDFEDDGRVPPSGLGPSLRYDVWIDLGEGNGPTAYPPKVIIYLAHEGLPQSEGYARHGVWLPRLEALGFPVLPKGVRPDPRQDCRGNDIEDKGQEAKRPTKALPIYSEGALTKNAIRTAAKRISTTAGTGRTDTYHVWVDGTSYGFWGLYHAAVKASGGKPRYRSSHRLPWGYQKEHDRVRALGFEVLPRGISPLLKTKVQDQSPTPVAITLPALQQAAELLALAPEFRKRREGRSVDLWVQGNGPYPVKAMCLLAWHVLALGWHEDWTKGGPDSSTNRHLASLPGVEILPKGAAPEVTRRKEQEEDIIEIERKVQDITTRKRLVDARVGQGRFRQDLERHWSNACAVTGVTVRQMLRASHIKPWRGSENGERLDPHNGLLLTANLDCLFDKGLISFADNGRLLMHPSLAAHAANLGLLGKSLRQETHVHLSIKRRRFLAMHRATFGFVD